MPQIPTPAAPKKARAARRPRPGSWTATVWGAPAPGRHRPNRGISRFMSQPAAPANRGGLPPALDEKQLKITLTLNVVKLLPLK